MTGHERALAEEVRVLGERVEALSARIALLEQGAEAGGNRKNKASTVAVKRSDEDFVDYMGREALLPKIASVSFMLVVALILRTLTDSGMLPLQAGSFIGTGYALALIVWGGELYRRGGRLAPVFPVCGSLLLYAIILETHSRFESLSTVWAFVLLGLAGLSVVAMGLRYRASILFCTGTLGAVATGLALDFPDLFFPALALLLLLVNVASHLAMRRAMCPASRWLILALSIVFWLLWSFKLNTAFGRGEAVPPLMGAAAFWPSLFIFWASLLAIGYRDILLGSLPLGFFEGALVPVSGLGVLLAAWSVASPAFQPVPVLGGLFVVAATGHLLVAGRLAGRGLEGAPGANVFSFAAVLLLLPSGPLLSREVLFLLPVWGGVSYLLLVLSGRWQNGGMRLTAYILQGLVGAVVLLGKVFVGASGAELLALPVALVLAGSGLYLYFWCRRHAPAAHRSAWFSWLDQKDFGALVFLVTGLLYAFFAGRLLLGLVLGAGTENFAFSCGQSVLVNTGAIVLLLTAARTRNLEILALAILVALLGAFKVFVLDLLSGRGVPLVVSVFSFGLVAVTGSIVSSRWGKAQPPA